MPDTPDEALATTHSQYVRYLAKVPPTHTHIHAVESITLGSVGHTGDGQPMLTITIGCAGTGFTFTLYADEGQEGALEIQQPEGDTDA